MDEPSWALRRKHRRYRHNILDSPEEAVSRFGTGADKACIDHILLDNSKDYPNLSLEELYTLLIEKEKTRQVSKKENIKLIREVNRTENL